ncbi:MAG TPA: phage tail protein [Ilumatobacteraceae bacterium]|jgi:phage tail-like protein
MPKHLEGAKTTAGLLSNSFAIDIPDLKITSGVTEVGGLNFEVNTIDVKQTDNSGRVYLKKRPGVVKYGELSIKRLATNDKSVYNWIDAIRSGKTWKRQDGSIFIYNHEGELQGTWEFQNGWPSKWSMGSLSATSDDTLVEEFTLVVEHLTRKV